MLPQVAAVPATGDGQRGTVDAAGDVEAVRFATPDSLERYLAGAAGEQTLVSRRAAREECFFLGLRLNRGVDLHFVKRQYGFPAEIQRTITELHATGLLEHDCPKEMIRLTAQGRLLANEVFERFLE